MKTPEQIQQDRPGTRMPGHTATLSETACNFLSVWFSKVGPSPQIDGDSWLLFRDTEDQSVIMTDHGRGYCTFYTLTPRGQEECGFTTTHDANQFIVAARYSCSYGRAPFVEFCRECIAEYQERERMYDR